MASRMERYLTAAGLDDQSKKAWSDFLADLPARQSSIVTTDKGTFVFSKTAEGTVIKTSLYDSLDVRTSK